MTACFVDTTILVNVSEGETPASRLAKKYALANSPATVPEYAFRELLAGRVGLLCDAHNKILASDNVIEVAAGFLRSAGFGRTPVAKAQEILASLKSMFDSESDISPKDAKRQVLEDLMMTAARLWRNARTVPYLEKDQPLPCFISGPIDTDESGILRGPNGSFSCSTGVPCGAAEYMYSKRSDLIKMIDALYSDSSDEKVKNKPENRSRRNALKVLEAKGPTAFPKRKCRALGDAYFAAMCPPGAKVLTTNIVDFEPLCAALGKTAVRP